MGLSLELHAPAASVTIRYFLNHLNFSYVHVIGGQSGVLSSCTHIVSSC